MIGLAYRWRGETWTVLARWGNAGDVPIPGSIQGQASQRPAAKRADRQRGGGETN